MQLVTFHSHCSRLFVWPLLTLPAVLASTFLWAGEIDASDHSLIHHPLLQALQPPKLDLNSKQSGMALPSFTKIAQVPIPVASNTRTTGSSNTTSKGTTTLTWEANTEPDLAGYKVYVGTSSGKYDFPGSPFKVGKVTTYTVTNLEPNTTYFFAISAYNDNGKESPLSDEVSKRID
jgi:hypothetical protein